MPRRLRTARRASAKAEASAANATGKATSVHGTAASGAPSEGTLRAGGSISHDLSEAVRPRGRKKRSRGSFEAEGSSTGNAGVQEGSEMRAWNMKYFEVRHMTDQEASTYKAAQRLAGSACR